MNSKPKQSELIAIQAMALCGISFRLHGRDNIHGYDCIGLAAECLEAAGILCDIPNGYSIRSGKVGEFLDVLNQAGFDKISTEKKHLAGDMLLVRPSPVQLHLLIRVRDGYVHAHAGLGRVTLSPVLPPWPIVSLFRLLEN